MRQLGSETDAIRMGKPPFGLFNGKIENAVYARGALFFQPLLRGPESNVIQEEFLRV